MTVIELDHVSRWYGNVVAVNDVTMTVGPGVTGLLGPNGAGKSTLLNLMAGFLSPSSGTVRIGGEPTRRNPDLYRKLGLVTEHEALHTFLTGRELVVASAKLHELPRHRDAAAEAIATVDMEAHADRRISTYSKGMRQRIRVACALVHNPEVLILDEPFNGMDPRQRLHMMDLLRTMAARGHTVLFSSHILEEVERLAGHVQVLVAGRLAAAGDYREIRRLMTDRPHVFTVRSTDDRRFATALMSHPAVTGVELTIDGIRIQTADFGTFTRLLAGVARDNEVSLREVLPADESLESVFSYLVAS